MRLLVVPSIALALGGCAAQLTPPTGAAQTTHLVCGSAVRLDISHDGQTAVIRDNDGRQTTLSRAQSSLGTRYAGGGLSVLRSGDTYVYTGANGSTLTCTRLGS